jgi:hypothetical protein
LLAERILILQQNGTRSQALCLGSRFYLLRPEGF